MPATKKLMKIEPSQIQVINNTERKRFEVNVNEHIAVSEYMLVQERIIFTHTEVPQALEGNGIGSLLARTALEYAREKGLKVMPLCPYIASYIRKHPEYRPLLLPGFNV